MSQQAHNSAKTPHAGGAHPAVGRVLIAIPVYNEAKYVQRVLAKVLEQAGLIGADVLIVDDGSTDQTPALAAAFPVRVLRHERNKGYGASLIDAFSLAAREGYDWIITMDCDEQHEPGAIPTFVREASAGDADILSGSRYLRLARSDDAPPPERRAVNASITAEINAHLSKHLGALLTDSFCGFKMMRVGSLAHMRLTEAGYAFPMQFWAQAAAMNLRVREVPVARIYNDPTRTFGAALDDAGVRLAHYRDVLHKEMHALRGSHGLAQTKQSCCGCGRHAAP